MRVGIEVGGTFTDLVAVEGESVRTAKVPSTPANPDEGAMQAIDAAGLDPGAISVDQDWNGGPFERLVRANVRMPEATIGDINDGCDGVESMLSNCSNIPVEAMESDYPFFRVEDYSRRSASGGAGRQRGGMGFQRVYRILDHDVTFATYGDRFRVGAEGLFGGGPGATAETYAMRGGQKIPLRSKQQFPLCRGDLLFVRTGGRGGYGPPGERAGGLAERDRMDGFASNPL